MTTPMVPRWNADLEFGKGTSWVTADDATLLEAVVEAAREMRLHLSRMCRPGCQCRECVSIAAFDAALTEVKNGD